MVVCLEQGADLHMAQLMPLPLTVTCFSKIQIGFTFLVPAHPGSPGQRAVKWVCVCVFVLQPISWINIFHVAGEDPMFIYMSVFRLQELRGKSASQDTDALG